MYQHLFGPVPSRRLGISLGIDLVPMKTCTLDCIYCECGQTTDLTIARGEYVPLESVKAECRHYLDHHPVPDYVTFSGSGEPTLNCHVGEVIRFIQSREQQVPVAVLTNGTLLGDPRVRDELKEAAVVIPSLDAATGRVFRKINRPHPRLDVNTFIDGLVRFRRDFSGQVWLEVFIVPGLNDTLAELTALKQAIAKIAPDRVQLNTLDRPGTVNNIRAADRTAIVSARTAVRKLSISGACPAMGSNAPSAEKQWFGNSNPLGECAFDCFDRRRCSYRRLFSRTPY